MLTTLTGFSQFVINILLPYTNTETRLVRVLSCSSSILTHLGHRVLCPNFCAKAVFVEINHTLWGTLENLCYIYMDCSN